MDSYLEPDRKGPVIRGLWHYNRCLGCDSKLCKATILFVERIKSHGLHQNCLACDYWREIALEHSYICRYPSKCRIPLCPKRLKCIQKLNIDYILDEFIPIEKINDLQ
jgi:hypothetical protein